MRPLESITGRLQRASLEALNLSGVRLWTPQSFSFIAGNAQIVVEVVSPAQGRGVVECDVASLRYRVEGDLDDENQSSVRAALGELVAVFRDFVETENFWVTSEPLRIMTFPELEAMIGAERLPERLWLDPTLSSRPSELLPYVRRLWRRGAETMEWTHLANVPVCLNSSQRPSCPGVEPGSARTGSLPASCRDCDVSSRCVGPSRGFEEEVDWLRPLRNGDSVEGTRRYIEAFCEEWEGASVTRALGIFNTILALRSSAPEVVYPPIECSLKIQEGRLLPRLRWVEYAPVGSGKREERARLNQRRREDLIGLCEGNLEADAAAEVKTWLEDVVQVQGDALEVSVGVELDVMTGALWIQLYAHLEPGDRGALTATVREALCRREGDPGLESGVVGLCETGLEGCGPVDVPLLALSVGGGRPSRSKLYFALPLATTLPTLGLESISVPAFEEQLPAGGLAVLELGGERTDWVKWDWPCTVHYQEIEEVLSRLKEGVAKEDCGRLESLFESDRFGTWPTWMSVNQGGVTFYFQPC